MRNPSFLYFCINPGYVLLTMAWIGSLYYDISNSDGISILTNPSFGLFNEPSPIVIIQEENSSISVIVD